METSFTPIGITQLFHKTCKVYLCTIPKLQLDDANKEGLKEKIAELHKFLDGQSAEVHEYDDSLVRRLIETITVYDDHFKVLFKSGIEVEVVA